MADYLRRNVLNNHLLVALVFVVLGWFLLEIRSILVIIFIAYIITSALSPLVDQLTKLHLNRGLAILLTYVFLLAGLALVVFPLVPFFVAQLEALFNNFPLYLERAAIVTGIGPESVDFSALIQAESEFISKNALTVTSKVFSAFFSFVTTLVLSLYFLIEQKGIHSTVAHLFGPENEERVRQIISDVDLKLGMWLRGQLLLSVSIGFATWIVLSVLSVPFAFPLAVIAGLLEAVPMVGPIISAVPAVIVALTISPGLALVVIGAYILIQLLENNLLVPRIMEQAVGLSPVAIIVGIMIGGSLLGITGALLVIPLVSVLTVAASRIKSS